MMQITCPVVSPAIRNLATEIVRDYPEECQRAHFNDGMCAMWVGYYNSTNNKTPDFIPGKKELVNSIEKRRNLDGKSFLSVPEKVTYTKGGKMYEYTVIGSHIFAFNGKEVYAADAPNAGVDRIKIFANLRVQRGEAVIVEHKNNKYVVNDNNQIVSVQTGKIMQWDDNNGDMKAILAAAKEEFNKKQVGLNNSNNNDNFAVTSNSSVLSEGLSKAIETGKWDATTIGELNNLITKIKNGEVDFKQSLGERRGKASSLSEIHAGASLILGTDVRAEKEERGNPQAKYEADAAEGREQERKLEAWAKAADLWLNDYEDANGNKANTLEDLLNSQWKYWNQGSEAEVYMYDDGVLLKSINLSHTNDNPGKLLDKIALFNTLFPSTAMEVVGFGRDSLGHFRVIVTQPFIEGTELTDADLEDFRKKYNLEDGASIDTEEGTIEVSDLGPSNILKDKEGNYFIIDADVTYTPNQTTQQQNIQQQPSSPSGATVNSTTTIQRSQIKSEAYDSALQTQDNRVVRFYRTFSPQQIKDRGAYIANLFSDIIDTHYFERLDELDSIINDTKATEEEKNAAKVEKTRILDPVNGRQYIAGEVIGIPQIMQEIKDTLQTWMEDDIENNEGRRAVLFQNTLDYFEDLFNAQASLDIEESEGIRIIGYTTENNTVQDEDAEERDNGDDDTGHVVSGSDGWNFQVRFENPFESMSKKVRGMFYDIERPETEKDDLGMTRHYSVGQIYASILSYFAKNVRNADDYMRIVKDINDIPEGSTAASIVEGLTQEEVDAMFPDGFPVFYAFEKMKDVYPWADQVITRLTNDFMSPEYNVSAKYPSTRGAMASQLYTNFKKAFIPYGKIKLNEDGIIPLNYQMEDRMQYEKLRANYNNRLLLTDKSVYDAQGRIVKDNVNQVADLIEKLRAEFEEEAYWDPVVLAEVLENNPEQYNKFLENARYALQSFGISTTTDNIAGYIGMSKDEEHPETMENHVLVNIFDDLLDIANALNKVEDDRIPTYNYIMDTIDGNKRKLWSHFFDGRGMITDASYMQSFYDSSSKKTKYSYSADNYLMQRFRGIAMGSREERRRFMDEHYGKYDWFRNQKTGEWRNKWLDFWYNLPDEEISELPYQNIDVVVEHKEHGEDKVRKYTDWETSDIKQVMQRSYAVDSWKKRDFTAMYLAPIFSDSPMSMTVRGPIMNDAQLFGGEDEAGNWRSGAFQELVRQEMSRMKLVQSRKAQIESGELQPITNFDGKRGLQFCFMPELNDYVFEDGKKFLDAITDMKNDSRYTTRDIDTKISEAVREILNNKHREFVGQAKYDPTAEELNQYYNMAYANAAIIQITTVDLAFYKDATDFQKRFKEVYAGGTQLNTNSRYGMATENVLLVSDDYITSPSYKNIAKVIDNAKNLSQKSKEDIKDMFRNINVADAQAIRSMYSFRSVLDMLGKWDDNMEATLNRFKDGTWTREDFDTLYQTLKPFAYSVIERNAGDGTRILVPQQHKNSEICALMMYDIISNGLGNSPVYRAFSRLMDEKDGIKGADGKPLIHMIQFESAGKVGNQGVINISIQPTTVISALDEGKYNLLPALDKDRKPLPNDLEHAFGNFFGKEGIKEQLDKRLEKGSISQKEYDDIIKEFRPSENEIIDMIKQHAIIKDATGNNTINEEFVHVMPFENYYEQQKTPAHHIDAEAVFGSQARNIAPADLPVNFEMTVDSVNGEHTIKGGEETVDFLYELLNENLIEDFFGKKGLKSIFASKKSLKEAVEEIVRGNPKYGKDFADALEINKDTGNFMLSPNSPTVFTKMQEIITSFFKNRITKQKINGAALIQAAGIGLDEELRVKFDANGKLLGAECYMPITSRKLFEPLLEEEEIDGKKQLVLKPERLKKAGLNKAVGYRIPTENKSSMMPLIIKGFTPLQNGSAIILPAEITTMAGSDFDVDKMFIMLTSFTVQNYAVEKAAEDYEHQYGFKIALNNLEEEDLSEEDFYGREQTSAELKAFKKWFEKHKDEYELDKPIVRAVKYDFSKTPKENGRKARNNMIIQMFYGILTSKSGSESLFNPQGFPDVERAAKIIRIAKDGKLRGILRNNLIKSNPELVPPVKEIRRRFTEDVRQRFPQEAEAAIERLNKMRDEDVIDLFIETTKPNISPDQVADALLNESTDNLKEFVKKYGAVESPVYPQTFINSHARNMAGVKQIGIYAVQASMAAKYQRATVTIKDMYRFKLNGNETHYIFQSNNGRTLKNDGQMVGASADNGKNPNLTDMGSTKDTATTIGLGLNMGLSHLDIALLINQPYMDLEGNVDLLHVKPVEITTKKLLLNIISPDSLTNDEKNYIKSMCYKLYKLNEAMEYVTKVSRADSPNGAMGNSYAKARVQRYKVDLLQGKMGQETSFPLEKIQETLRNDAVTVSAGENTVRDQLKAQKMGLLHGMYALGINSFDTLMKDYFFGARKSFDDMVVKPLLYNQPDTKSDDSLYELVDNIYTSYIIYTLSGSTLFGNETNSDGSIKTMKQKREEYLNDFPGEFRRILSENKKVRDLLESILEVVPDGNRSKIALKDVGSLSKEMRAEVEMRFNSLLYDDDPDIQKLAKNLFIYSYFRNGLQFTHDSFAHLFTTTFLLSFPVYNQSLESLDRDLSETDDKESVDNFIAQFLVTNPDAAFDVTKILSNDKVNKEDVTVTDDVLIIDLNNQYLAGKMRNDVLSPNPKKDGVMPYPYIRYDGDVYILDQEKYKDVKGKPVYHKLKKYATYPKNPIFSSQMSVAELAEEFPIEEGAPMYDYPDIGDSYYPGAPMEYQTSSSYPYDNNNTGAPMEDNAAAPIDDDWGSANIDGVSSADVYRRGGENTMEQPFCK